MRRGSPQIGAMPQSYPAAASGEYGFSPTLPPLPPPLRHLPADFIAPYATSAHPAYRGGWDPSAAHLLPYESFVDPYSVRPSAGSVLVSLSMLHNYFTYVGLVPASTPFPAHLLHAPAYPGVPVPLPQMHPPPQSLLPPLRPPL